MAVPYETIREITKAAIENDAITFQKFNYEDEQKCEKQNAFNAKQITDFIEKLNSTFEHLRLG